jgi:hypothetical protein
MRLWTLSCLRQPQVTTQSLWIGYYKIWYLVVKEYVNRVCVFGVATRLGDGRSGVRMAAGTRNCFVSNHPVYCSVDAEDLPRKQSRQNMKLTNHLHLVPRLGMSGAVPILPLYAVMAWPGTTVSLQLQCKSEFVPVQTVTARWATRGIAQLIL